MASVRSSNPYEGDNGLHCIEAYFSFDSYTGNDIWINYELSMKNSSSSVDKIFPYAQPKPNLLFTSKITNGRIFVDTSTSGEAYKMYYYSAGSWTRLYDFNTSSTGGKTYWAQYNSCKNNGFYRYNAHLHDDVIDFYVNGNYYSRMNLASKYFTFTNHGSARSTQISNENNYLKYITLTDKMATDIPKPPYSLDEKNNELYGYKK